MKNLGAERKEKNNLFSFRSVGIFCLRTKGHRVCSMLPGTECQALMLHPDSAFYISLNNYQIKKLQMKFLSTNHVQMQMRMPVITRKHV
jgi:hypothetical protein